MMYMTAKFLGVEQLPGKDPYPPSTLVTLLVVKETMKLVGDETLFTQLEKVTDSERLLREPAYLADLLHLHTRNRGSEESWRLIVLEDAGELLAADAKEQAGQGLSRLLNVVDGLLGESSRALFLVTTNENLSTFHPAVTRPGRCAQILEFTALSAEESNTWLQAQGSESSVKAPATLAELFAIRDHVDPMQAPANPSAFGRRGSDRI